MKKFNLKKESTKGNAVGVKAFTPSGVTYKYKVSIKELERIKRGQKTHLVFYGPKEVQAGDILELFAPDEDGDMCFVYVKVSNVEVLCAQEISDVIIVVSIFCRQNAETYPHISLPDNPFYEDSVSDE